MTSATYKNQKFFDNTNLRKLNPDIKDRVMYTFEVRVIVDQDWLDENYREAFSKNENNAYTNSFFRHIYKHAQQLVHKKLNL